MWEGDIGIGSVARSGLGWVMTLVMLLVNSNLASAQTGQCVSNYNRVQEFTGLDSVTQDRFGKGIDVSGDYLIVGSPQDSQFGAEAGAAYIFERNAQGVWNQATRLALPASAPGRGCGFKVGIAGDHAAVACYSPAVGSPIRSAVYIFERDAQGVWSYATELMYSDPNFSTVYASDLAMSQGRIAVYGQSGTLGDVQVFERDAQGAWPQVARLDVVGQVGTDGILGEVDISGDTIALGSQRDDQIAFNTGAVYVFTRDAQGVWAQTDKLVASDAVYNEQLGHAVALDGDLLVVGAYGGRGLTPTTGAVYIFERDAHGTWVESTKLRPRGVGQFTIFGDNVAVDGDLVAVVAIQSHPQQLTSSAFLFERSSTGRWRRGAELIAPPRSQYDIEVVVSSATVFLGLPYGSVTLGNFEGAVQVFEPSGLSANDDDGVTLEDTSVTLDVLSNDATQGGASVTQVGFFDSGGQATIDASNRIVYTPAPDFYGTETFEYTISESTFCASARVTVTVTPTPDVPVAWPATVGGDEDTSIGFALRGSDPDGDALTFEIVDPPRHGTLDTSTLPNLTYTPNPDYNGTDTLTFIVNDGVVDSAPAGVNLEVFPVNDAPVVIDQSASTQEDTPTLVRLRGLDPENDALNYEVVAQPSHGALTGVPPELTYTPEVDFNGTDTFTYLARDAMTSSNIGTVTVLVMPVPNAPVANEGVLTLAEDTTSPIVLTGRDGDDDALSFRVTRLPDNGTLTGTPPNLTYAPRVDFHGTDTLGFVANDGTLDSGEASIAITVTPVNDPPVATDVMVATQEDVPVVFDLLGTDPDADDLTYRAEDPVHGMLAGVGSRVTYTPDEDFDGTDTFTYTVSDGMEVSPVGTVTVVVMDTPNLPPEFVAPTPEQGTLFQVRDGEELAFVIAARDPDGEPLPLTYEVDGAPLAATFDGVTGSFSWVPGVMDVRTGDLELTLRATDGLATIERSLMVSLAFTDSDEDGVPDAVEEQLGLDPTNPDSDGDGVPDGDEVGDAFAPNEQDGDGDGLPDYADPDSDGDGVDDSIDNCPGVANADQVDLDSDALGSACDGDESVQASVPITTPRADSGCCAVAPTRRPLSPVVVGLLLMCVFGLIRTHD